MKNFKTKEVSNRAKVLESKREIEVVNKEVIAEESPPVIKISST